MNFTDEELQNKKLKFLKGTSFNEVFQLATMLIKQI